MVVSLTFQLVSAAASVGRVMTRDYVVSRSFNALALGAVAADFAVRYAFYVPASAAVEYSQAPQAAYMVGLLIFTILTIRTLLILCWPRIEKDYRLRVLTCFAAFVLCFAAGVAIGAVALRPDAAVANIHNSAPFRVMAWIPFVGIGLGCLGEASNDMPTRRRYVLAMGCVMATFAFSTAAWGLLFKNLFSDVGATLVSMIKFGDAPFTPAQLKERSRIIADRRQDTRTRHTSRG
jgi:hypothetical protein